MEIAVVLLAGSDTPDGTGRMANALITALEAQDAGDDIRVNFDGAATTWITVLAEHEHKYHRLLKKVRAQRHRSVPVLRPQKLGWARYSSKSGISAFSTSSTPPYARALLADGFEVTTL